MKNYIYNIKWYVILSILANVINISFLAIMPYFVKIFFDYATGQQMDNTPLSIAIAYLVCIVVVVISKLIENINQYKSDVGLELAIKKDFFKSIAKYDYKKFKTKSIGEYISIQDNDLILFINDYIRPIIDILKSINGIVIFGLVMCLYIDWRVSLVVFTSSFLTALIAPRFYGKELSERRLNYLSSKGKYVSTVEDLLNGFDFVQKQTRESFLSRHSESLSKVSNKRYYFGMLKSLSIIVRGFFYYLIDIIAIFVIVYLMIKKEISLGEGVAALSFIECFTGPIESIIEGYNLILSTKGTRQKIQQYLENNIAEDADNNYKKNLNEVSSFTQFNRSIELKNISVKLDDFELFDLSYKFEKGKKYAIIGNNGSGKSVLLKTIMKQHELENGVILLDGRRVSDTDIYDIIWSISQREHFFKADYYQNISLFSSIKLKDIFPLAKLIRPSVISSIKKSKDVRKLSGGEKQILSIWRMSMVNMPILAMDEPYSAVDSETSSRVHNYIMKNIDKTVLMVTHKLTNLKLFDEIILMENGRIIASGSYDKISKDECFLDFYKNANCK